MGGVRWGADILCANVLRPLAWTKRNDSGYRIGPCLSFESGILETILYIVLNP